MLAFPTSVCQMKAHLFLEWKVFCSVISFGS
jgi:hypothetical protein